ncbi:MAG: sugar transferase [Candidatus Methanoperedens sp.]
MQIGNVVNTKRLFDFLSASSLLLVLLPIILFISLFIKLTSDGPVFYISDRVGVQNNIFKMYKFRTMIVGTPPVATHLLINPEKYLTPTGRFLRKTSLDELPQLFNIIRGKMSVVGPRPALYNQNDLIELRTKKGIHKLIPGFTGWAQINGRDGLSIPEKVDFDEYYLKHQCFLLDLKIIWKTIFKVIKAEGVKH